MLSATRASNTWSNTRTETNGQKLGGSLVYRDIKSRSLLLLFYCDHCKQKVITYEKFNMYYILNRFI